MREEVAMVQCGGGIGRGRQCCAVLQVPVSAAGLFESDGTYGHILCRSRRVACIRTRWWVPLGLADQAGL